MFKTGIRKNTILLFTVMSMFVFPILVEAGGGCGCKSSSYQYNYPSSYGRTSSVFGYPYSYSSYPGFSSYYPSTVGYNTIMPYSSYPGIYSQPYSFGSLGFGGYYGGGLGTVTSKDYTAEQSYTRFVPGGLVTNSISESTEISYLPYGNYMSYPTFGVLGGLSGFGGWY